MGQRALPRTGSTREPDAGLPWLVTGYRLSAARLEEALHTLRLAAELLGWRDGPTVHDLSSHGSARELLARAWRDAAASVAGAAADPARLAGLVDLLRAVKDVDDRVRDEMFARQNSVVELVREALSMLRDLRSVAEVVERAPAATAAIGFDRAVVSRIERSVWMPESSFVARDPKWAEEILEAGRGELRTLDSSLLETEIVRRQRPLVVSDVANRPDLHRPLVETSMTRSYAAAPIVGWGRVIGFVHADCFHQRRNLDAMDRDLLWMFCEGLGALITRGSLLDGLAGLRDGLGRLAGAPGTDPGGDPGFTPSGGLHDTAPGPRTAASPFGDVRGTSLTPREVDVLRLMAGGNTNGQIARRLVISEGTVKSHVKHILRKMGAANRAEAVSRWMDSARGPVRSHSRHQMSQISVS